MRHVILFIAALATSACSFGDSALGDIDPNAAPATPTYALHVAPIMEQYCTACHAPDAQPGEQEGYGYETCAKVRENWDGVVETVFETSEMPPGGAVRVSEPEKLALARWWAQGGRCE